MAELSNRDVAPVTDHNSGSMRPGPTGRTNDPRAGGEIPTSSYVGKTPGLKPDRV
jgi:hypothetical protein